MKTGDRVKFRFGNQGSFIYGTITKAGLVCDILSDSGLLYSVPEDKCLPPEVLR